MNEKEQKIIHLRKAGKTLEEVGKEFGVTRERIRQIEVKAIEKLKYELKSKIYTFSTQATLIALTHDKSWDEQKNELNELYLQLENWIFDNIK